MQCELFPDPTDVISLEAPVLWMFPLINIPSNRPSSSQTISIRYSCVWGWGNQVICLLTLLNNIPTPDIIVCTMFLLRLKIMWCCLKLGERGHLLSQCKCAALTRVLRQNTDGLFFQDNTHRLKGLAVLILPDTLKTVIGGTDVPESKLIGHSGLSEVIDISLPVLLIQIDI